MKRENTQPTFPKTWLWFADDFLPSWVKRQFSPRENWKNKPFTQDDGRFFLKGVRELSDIFTEDRSRKLKDYFNHPRFRSSYFLYFVPLQAGKFCTLFSRHEDAVGQAIQASSRGDELVLVDLGAGPGTASLALLLTLLGRSEKLPSRIRFHWVDQNEAILRDGRRLIEEVVDHFAELRGKVSVELHISPWKTWARKWKGPIHLLLAGNVLNESSGTAEDLEPLVRQTSGGGALFMEPAFKASAQGLSQIRDALFESEILPASGASLWGPCLHAERCPLSQGRDWCHFSVFLKTPGKWFEFFSKGLGSAREWQKYHYLWLAAPDSPAPEAARDLRRVVSDPLVKASNAKVKQVLLCEPERPGRLDLTGLQRLWRGDLVDLRR